MDERWRHGSMSRRTFLARSLGAAAFAGVAITITACGDDDSNGGSGPGEPCTGRVTGDVSSSGGHTHTVDDVCSSDAGNSAVLTLSGFGHTHTVTLSEQQVDDVLGGVTLTVTSSSDAGHNHDVTFN